MTLPAEHPLVLESSPGGAHLALDADGVLRLAAQSLFSVLAEAVEGMLVVDRHHRILWISDGYKRFLPALGFADVTEFVGRRVEEVIPNSQMAEVLDTGKPVLVDLLTNKAGTFVVSRLPLRDDHGTVIGALGMVLLDHPETNMQPLIAKFGALQRELEDTKRRLTAEQVRNRSPKYTVASFVGSSPAAQEIKRQARRVAQSNSTVLLLGETGTGKELLAHAIHAVSHRAHKPFVTVNIAAVPETLLEAEFFGVAPGAYTGADRKGRDGKFKLADGGTLFLDEIGEMPLAVQGKLLRVLQEREFEPLGSNWVTPVDVRVIAATSRDLPAMVAAGTFRADLYYRLSALLLRVPPLRERREDIASLVDTLCDDITRRSGTPHKLISPDGMAWLAQQPWPGNVRELRNVLEQANLLSDSAVLGVVDFEALGLHGLSTWRQDPIDDPPPPDGPIETIPRLPDPRPTPTPLPTMALRPLPEQIEAIERDAIAQALAWHGGNRVAAARQLGISRASLYQRLARWPDLDSPDAGPAASSLPRNDT